MVNKTQLSREEIDVIIDAYCNKKYGLVKTGKLVGVNERIVRKVLIQNNIHIRSLAEANAANSINVRKYSVNDDYFDNESHNMAYILGFLSADGTVSRNGNRIKIGLSSVDRNFLELIKEELGVEKKIFDYETNNGYLVSELSFNSQKIKQKLAEYNVVPGKTETFTFPTNLSKKYWIDFIRGYFDGDGSVGTAGPSAIRWQICSHRPQVLETIVEFLFEEYGIPKVSVQKNEHGNSFLYTIQYSNNSTRKIFQILYTPNSLYLPRKFEKFKSII